MICTAAGSCGYVENAVRVIQAAVEKLKFFQDPMGNPLVVVHGALKSCSGLFGFKESYSQHESQWQLLGQQHDGVVLRPL